MLDRLKKFLQDDDRAKQAAEKGVDEVQLGAAALLLEAAGRDGKLDPAERDKIESLIAARFGIGETEIERLLTQSCLLYTSPSPRDLSTSRMPSSA